MLSSHACLLRETALLQGQGVFWLPAPMRARPSRLARETVAQAGIMPVTAARPRRIFTVFRFLSE